MRNVVQQTIARGHELFEAMRHRVEIQRKVRNLVAAPTDAVSQPDVEIALRQTVEAVAKQFDRAGEIPGENEAERKARNRARDQNGPGNIEGTATVFRRGVAIGQSVDPAVRRPRQPRGRHRPVGGAGSVYRLDRDLAAIVRGQHRNGLPISAQPICGDVMREDREQRRRYAARNPLFRGGIATGENEDEPEPLDDAEQGEPEAQQDLPEKPRLHDACRSR
jgi:hypothetical protein